MEQFDEHQLEKNDQQLFTDSFNFCCELVKRKEYYDSERETNILSRLSLNYGQDMYDAIMVIMNKIIKSNKNKVKVESTKIVTTKATRDSDYYDNYDQLNQQQQQQVDKVDSQNEMILKKRKISADVIHSEKMFKADNKKNNCDNSSNSKNIQIVSLNGNKDEMLSVTGDSIDVNKTHNLDNHSVGLDIKSNEISNFFKDNNQSRLNEVIKSVEHQRNTRIRTGSLAPKKNCFCAEDDDDVDVNVDVDIDDVNGGDDDNDDYDYDSLNQNESREGTIEITDENSIKEKKRVVKLATENPNWSLDLLRERSGCEDIRNRRQVELWTKQIEQGGSFREKINFLNNWIVYNCIENQKKGEVITNKKIRTWGFEAKKKCKLIKFSASDGWLTMLKKKYGTTGKPNNLKINCNLQRKKWSSSSNVQLPFELKVVDLAYEKPQ